MSAAGVGVRRTMSLGLALAERSARAAMVHATGLAITICVAVCDEQGRLAVFFKMDGTTALAGHEAVKSTCVQAVQTLA